MKIESARKILAVGIAAALLAMSFALTVSMEAEALDFIDGTSIQVPWTSSFTPLDSAWDSTGNHAIVVGRDGSGIQPSAWYYNEPSNTWSEIYESADPAAKPVNTVQNADTGATYATIQAAINSAEAGHELNVWAGTYNENIFIEKAITVTGNGSANTVIQGTGTGNAVAIRANGVTFRGFTVTGAAGYIGIVLYNVQNCRVENNTVSGNAEGISVQGSSNNIIKGNTIENNNLGLSVKTSQATKGIAGVTRNGGKAETGAMFKMDLSGENYNVLHDALPKRSDGRYPGRGRLATDGSFLYGMTTQGGIYNYGTIFRMNTDGSDYTILREFRGGSKDGKYPYGGLLCMGSVLYGMTRSGGVNDWGTIFSINTDGSGFEMMYNFTSSSGGYPYGSLTATDGNTLYGLTSEGGDNWYGTIFNFTISDRVFTKLHSFSFENGTYPYGDLAWDGGSYLYGMTNSGTSFQSGSIFRWQLDTDTFELIWVFSEDTDNGRYPQGSPTLEGSVLYGMTREGGSSGNGTVFKLTTDTLAFTILHNFTDPNTDGSYPYGSLETDGAYLYGLTESGGSSWSGTVFKIRNTGTEFVVLHNFTGGADGYSPQGSLLRTGTNLYGMTAYGGQHGHGTIFNITTAGAFTHIRDFASEPGEGTAPSGAMIQNGTVLYGMTNAGGKHDRGTIYRMNIDGSGFEVVRSLDYTNGSNPYGGLIRAGSWFYGMTHTGGSTGQGVIFKIRTGGTDYARIHNFTGSEGSYPRGDLTWDGGFWLYGMTAEGGNGAYGTVFKIGTDGTSFTLLHNFSYGAQDNGAIPYGNLTLDGDNLYGMTYMGGTHDFGTIFTIRTDGTGFTLLRSFEGHDGSYPYGGLTRVGSQLYGMTRNGGDHDYGTIFRINTDGSGYLLLHSLYWGNGFEYPSRSLVLEGGFLYGMTSYGSGYGTVLRLQLSNNELVRLRSFSGSPKDAGIPEMNDVTILSYPSQTSTGNLIHHNNFLGNGQQARDDSPGNFWNISHPGGGNRWSDYSGADLGGDGIGDTAYIIMGSAGAKDDRPWMRLNGWTLPYTIFRSVAWDNVHKRFWVCGDYAGNAGSAVYYITPRNPTSLVPIPMGEPITLTALAVDNLGNVLVAGNDLEGIFYYNPVTEMGYKITDFNTGSMYGWNITGITFNPNDSRFYMVGNVKNQNDSVAFYTDQVPLNDDSKCHRDTSDFINSGVRGLRSISWNPTRNYGLVVGDGVYRVNAYGGNQALTWSTVAEPRVGISYRDISWDPDGWNEAAIVGNNQTRGNYWRYYNTNPRLIQGHNDTGPSNYTTCAFKPPSSAKWVLIPAGGGAVRVNAEQVYEGDDITLNVYHPQIYRVEFWKTSDVGQNSLLNRSVDADSTYTFMVEGSYTESGFDRWGDLQINLTGWYDDGKVGLNSQPRDPTWTSGSNRTTQFRMRYTAGIGAEWLYPMAGASEISLDNIWVDPVTYGPELRHRVMFNITFGPQTRAANGHNFKNSTATNGNIWNRTAALNDPYTWDIMTELRDTTDSSVPVNRSYEEFGFKEYMSIYTTGNAPFGSAPPGSQIQLSNPSMIYYSTNTHYRISVSIPHLYLNGNEASPYYINAIDVSVQNMRLFADASNSGIASSTDFPDPSTGLVLYVWGTGTTNLSAPGNGTQSVGPLTNYTLASYETQVNWWVNIPIGTREGAYRATIRLTLGN